MNRFGPLTCKVCHGKECLGGGHKKCAQRDPRPSAIAAVLDSYGNASVVVTYRNHIKYHVREGDFAILSKVPVHEPIAWSDIPGLLAHMEWVVEDWINNNRPNEPHKVEAITMYRLRRLDQ